MVQDKGRTMTLYLVVETDVFTRCVRHAVTSRDMVLVALAEVPLAALAFWALGAWIPFDYWMRRLCFRAGLAGLVMTSWPAASSFCPAG